MCQRTGADPVPPADPRGSSPPSASILTQNAFESNGGFGMVAEQDFPRRGDIFEADLAFLAQQIGRGARDIAFRLLAESRQSDAFSLCLDDAAQPSIDEERVVDRSGISLELAHGDAPARRRHSCRRGSARPSRTPPTADRSPSGRCLRDGRLR